MVDLRSNSIDSVSIFSKTLHVTLKNGQSRRTTIPHEFVRMKDLWEALMAAKVKVSKSIYEEGFKTLAKAAVAVSSLAYMGYVLYYLHSTLKGEDSHSLAQRVDNEPALGVTFDEIVGVGAAKEELLHIVGMLKANQSVPIPRGILLYGPSGSGKTLLAKALASEAGVAFFSCAGSEFVDVYAGRGAARIRDLFQRARRSSPAVVFIDEIDCLAQCRDSGLGSNEEREQTLNQLLYEMDSIKSALAGRGVIVVAATNRVRVLDEAVLRSGRFDYHIEVPLPSPAERLQIVTVQCKSLELSSDVDLSHLAALSQGFSGADLKLVVDEAARLAFRRKREMLSMEDFIGGLNKLKRLRLDKSEY